MEKKKNKQLYEKREIKSCTLFIFQYVCGGNVYGTDNGWEGSFRWYKGES